MENQNKKAQPLPKDLSSPEDYVQDLFTFSPLPICFVSPVGIILAANPAFEKFSNVYSGEIIGKSIDELFENKEIEKLAEDTLKNGFVEAREMRFFSKNKEKLICQAFTKARKNEKGKSIGYFIAIFDMTEFKEKEKDLRSAQSALLNILEDTEEARQRAEEEKNKTQTIISGFIDGLLFFNQEGKLVLINPQAGRFLNIETENIIGKMFSELDEFKSLTDILKGGVLPAFGKKALPPKKFRGKKTKIFRKEWEINKDFILEVSTIPLEIGEEKGTLVILHDVSREKLVERLKTEFVSIAAHQLRTPLSAIKWTLKMFLDGDLGKVTPEQQEFLMKTYKSNERMIALINSLLNVTRIEEGRFLYRPTFDKIDELAESVIKTLASEASRKQLKIVFKKENNLPKILMDAEKMRLAINNLIDNAIRYTLPGGKIEVKLTQKGGEVEFIVKDSGVGIPSVQQKRIFSKFFRGLNALKLETEGSGLGLFIAKNVIEAHGGKI